MKQLMLKLSSASVTLVLFLSTHMVIASDDAQKVDRGFYLGAGIGLSLFDPETQGSLYKTNDKKDSAYSFVAGYDINKNTAIELEYANLGKTTFTPTGHIAYKTQNLGMIYYFGGEQTKLSFRPFAKLGIGKLQHSANIPVDARFSTHLLFGAGFEKGLSQNLSLRGEVVSYDKDILKSGLTLLYRMPSKHTSSDTINTVVEIKAPTVKPIKAAQVSQYADVLFAFDSSTLNQKSQNTLSTLANEMTSNESLKVHLYGHTDSQGASLYNLKLSIRRAKSVRNYLLRAGIAVNRISITGLGEQEAVRGTHNSSLDRRVVIGLTDKTSAKFDD